MPIGRQSKGKKRCSRPCFFGMAMIPKGEVKNGSRQVSPAPTEIQIAKIYTTLRSVHHSFGQRAKNICLILSLKSL